MAQSLLLNQGLLSTLQLRQGRAGHTPRGCMGMGGVETAPASSEQVWRHSPDSVFPKET